MLSLGCVSCLTSCKESSPAIHASKLISPSFPSGVCANAFMVGMPSSARMRPCICISVMVVVANCCNKGWRSLTRSKRSITPDIQSLISPIASGELGGCWPIRASRILLWPKYVSIVAILCSISQGFANSDTEPVIRLVVGTGMSKRRVKTSCCSSYSVE